MSSRGLHHYSQFNPCGRQCGIRLATLSLTHDTLTLVSFDVCFRTGSLTVGVSQTERKIHFTTTYSTSLD